MYNRGAIILVADGQAGEGSESEKDLASGGVIQVEPEGDAVTGRGRPSRRQFGYLFPKKAEEGYAAAFTLAFRLVTLPAIVWAGCLFAAVAVVTFFYS